MLHTFGTECLWANLCFKTLFRIFKMCKKNTYFRPFVFYLFV